MSAAGARLATLAIAAALAASGCSGPDLDVPDTSLDVVEVLPRPTGFTQGLELLDDGTLLHSTGGRGRSAITLLRLDGSVVARSPLPGGHYGEGVTQVGSTVYQLTWQDGVVYTWSVPDLEPGPTYALAGEGWGLCHDDTRGHLWLSDGSNRLRALALPDLRLLGVTAVTLGDGTPLASLNELECVDGHVWANVWMTDTVVEIDPASGAVLARHDLQELREVVRPRGQQDVLNGIAHDDRDDTWLVTGKNWDRIFRVRLSAAAGR